MTAWDVAMGFRKMADANKVLIRSAAKQIKTEKNPKGAGPKEFNIQKHSIKPNKPTSSICITNVLQARLSDSSEFLW